MKKQPNNPEQNDSPANNANTPYSQDFLPWLWQSDDKEAVEAREAISRSKQPSISQEVKRQRQKF